MQEGLDGGPIFGSYRSVLSQIINIDGQVFEMLYNEETENASEYDLASVDLVATFERLEQFQ